MRTVWTKEKEEFLINNYRKYKLIELSELLDIPKSTITKKASKLKLSKSLNEDEVNEVIKLYLNGETIKDIAKKFKINRSTLGLLIPNDIKVKESPLVLNEIVDLYEYGFSTIDISKLYIVSISSVNKFFKVNNIRIRNKEEIDKMQKAKLPINEIIDLYNYGFSATEIGKLYNINPQPILNALRSNDVEIRTTASFYVKGAKSSNWKGGITSKNKLARQSEEYFRWRRLVFKRDRCRCCTNTKSSAKLHAHHINNFSNNENKRYDVSNGILLCEYCHISTHKGSFHNIYGMFNNDIHQLQEYFDETRKHLNLPPIDIVEDIIYKDYIFEN